MNLLFLFQKFNFDEIQEQFLDIYPEEKDELDKYKYVFNLLKKDHLEVISDLSNYKLVLDRRKDGTPFLLIQISENENLELNTFEWIQCKNLIITDEMLIECSLERLTAITLYEFGYEMIWSIFHDDL